MLPHLPFERRIINSIFFWPKKHDKMMKLCGQNFLSTLTGLLLVFAPLNQVLG